MGAYLYCQHCVSGTALDLVQIQMSHKVVRPLLQRETKGRLVLMAVLCTQLVDPPSSPSSVGWINCNASNLQKRSQTNVLCINVVLPITVHETPADVFFLTLVPTLKKS